MNVRVISRIDSLDDQREQWKAVYSGDPSATVFQSWGWIRGWIDAVARAESPDDGWIVLAVEDALAEGYVSFLPLGTHRVRGSDGKMIRKLSMGGTPWSDNTGLLCLPEFVDAVLPALGGFLRKEMEWDVFEFRNLCDRRVEFLVEYLERSDYAISTGDDTVCPCISLPETWNQYLTDCLSANVRSNLKRFTGKVMKLPGFEERPVCADTLEGHTETLLRLWMDRWGLRLDDVFMGYRTEVSLDVFRSVYRHCFEAEDLYLTIIWAGSEPLAGDAAFLDKKRNTVYQYTKAFNMQYEKYRPGHVMTGYAIRTSIEKGFRTYDFGAGDEQYKRLYGAAERRNRNITVKKKNMIDKVKQRMPQVVKNFGKKLWAGSRAS